MATNPLITLINDESLDTAPLDYWLDSWRNHEDATAALLSAAEGLASQFYTPNGGIIVRRASPNEIRMWEQR